MAHKILVSGASGHLGRLVLDGLLARGVAAGDIIATTREPANLASYAARGVEVRKADFDNADLTEKAFNGADRMVLISTDALDDKGTRQRQQIAAVAAAKAAGVKHIVYTSLPDAETSKVIFAPDHLNTENAIKNSGLSYTILRNTWYQENLIRSLEPVLKSGQWFTASGKGKVAHIARADCADVVASVLASGTTERATYTLTGGTLRDTDEIAAMVSRITGKPITVVHISDDQLAGGMKAAGVPDFLIPTLVSFDTAIRAGNLSALTKDVETLSGKAPKLLETFLEESKGALLA
jgi:NAD(P)H dehydrogenase (quinone)